MWCTSASDCFAVGSAPKGVGNVPLAERWNGNSWKIQKVPTPAGFGNSHLTGVTCTSPHMCEAVGFAAKGNREVPLAERWNGATWRIQPAPARSGFSQNVLSGVACSAADSCVAVGGSAKPPRFDTLAELWNGVKWSIQTTPNPSTFNELNAVSCPSRNDCMAVGNDLGARWNGRKWTALKLGFPGSPADLTAISCTKTGACYADGGFYMDAILTAVAEFWNGSRWKVQDTPITTSNDSSVFNGISCTTATNCTGVGSYHDPVDGNRALAEDFALRWQDVSPSPFFGSIATGINAISCTSPNACVTVGGTETATEFDAFAQVWASGTWINAPVPKPKVSNLASVSCTAGGCTAVGDIRKGGTLVTLAERFNGTNWTIQGTPNPAGATGSFLLSVSCHAKNACTAVGFARHGGGQVTLAEHWNGKSWKLQHTPNPPHASSIELNAVSCASASSCQAVGSTSTGSFAEAWNGSSWKLLGVPLPKGGTNGFLFGVSCTSASACIAVGDYVHRSHTAPLAERWNGRRWSALAAAAPRGVMASGLASVSCTSAQSCSAVGFVFSTATNALAERWNGRTWSRQPIDRPPGSQSTELASVSCNSPVACMAVGNYTDLSATEQMLAEQYS